MSVRKRRFGDRDDGRRIRTLQPMLKLIPFTMRVKNQATDYIRIELDIDEAEKYIRRKRAEGLHGFGMLHFFTAAYVRLLSQRPALNRFVSGLHVYQRNEIRVNMAIKKELSLEGLETTVITTFDRTDSAVDVFHKLNSTLADGKSTGNSNNADKLSRTMTSLPAPLLHFVMWCLEKMDYFNIMPRSIRESSPFHTSTSISDLGSIRLPPVYHHLYEFGNCPMFFTIGTKQKKYELQKDGTVKERKTMEFILALDERICDGYSFANALQVFISYFKTPDILDKPPEKVIEDID